MTCPHCRRQRCHREGTDVVCIVCGYRLSRVVQLRLPWRTEDLDFDAEYSQRTYDHDRILRLRAEGLQYKQIAQRLGCSLSAVSNVLRRAGLVPPRASRQGVRAGC